MNPISQSIIDKNDQESITILAKAVSKAIGENEGNKRFIDLERIPLICLSISNISKALDDIKIMITSNRTESDEQHKSFLTKEAFQLEFGPIKSVVFGVVGLALIAMAGAVIALIIK